MRGRRRSRRGGGESKQTLRFEVSDLRGVITLKGSPPRAILPTSGFTQSVYSGYKVLRKYRTKEGCDEGATTRKEGREQKNEKKKGRDIFIDSIYIGASALDGAVSFVRATRRLRYLLSDTVLLARCRARVVHVLYL